MSESLNNAGTKKKTKKRRKGKNVGKGPGGAPRLPEESATDMPKQVSEEDPVITTVKCPRCKGLFRQMVMQNGISTSEPRSSAQWMCPSCHQLVKTGEDGDDQAGGKSLHVAAKDSGGVVSNGGCNCTACVAKRENAVSPEMENDAQVTQRHWMEIRQMVRSIYRENMSLANQGDKSQIGSKEMVDIVTILSSRDPHLFFQRLETLAREYLLEVKVRLLEQLSCGFNSPQLAIEFIQMLLDEYAILCNALPSLLFLLKPVESCDSVKKLGMTIELMNKNIFRELIFAESFMSSNLPLIIAQLRLASFSADHYHRTTAEELSHRYTILDEEMNEINKVWKIAIDHLNNLHIEDRKNHFERIRADGESFKQQVKMQNSEEKTKSTSKTTTEGSRETLTRSSSRTGCEGHLMNGTSSSSSLSSEELSTHTLLKSHIGRGLGFSAKEAEEWSKLLFKCMTPMGEPDFQIKGATAMLTVTLHADMTRLDLSNARACCHRDQMMRYLDMGLTTEEVVELTLKMAALQALGIHLRIEDLFDDEGFSLSDVNRVLVGRPTSLPRTDVDQLVHSDDENDSNNSLADSSGAVEGCGCLFHSPQDEVNFKYLKEKVLLRQKYNMSKTKSSYPGSTSKGSVCSNCDRCKQQDFLQGLVMKIRFTRRLRQEEVEKVRGNSKEAAPDSSLVMSSFDKVQVKLTQLELSSVRIMANSKSIGQSLGPDKDLPTLSPPMHPLSIGSNGKLKSDYMFVHTDVHQEFMDLLLEKRRGLDQAITAKEKARREAAKKSLTPTGDTTGSKMSAKSKSAAAAAAGAGGKKENYKSKEELSADTPTYPVQDHHQHDNPPHSTLSSGSSNGAVRVGKVENEDGNDLSSRIMRGSYQSSSLRTQPCQCSACIGAVATIVCPNYRIKLAETDRITIECSLGHNEGGRHRKGTRDKLGCKTNNMDATHSTDLDALSPMSKEGLWQNWMSTSGSAQLENESHISNGNHHYGNPNCIHGNEGDPMCMMHEYECNPSVPHMPRSCSNHLTSSSCLAKENEVCKNSGHSAPGDGSRKCLCAYCELFGHNGPPTAPTSQNYTKRRDIMRQKLQDKKKRKDQKSSGSSRSRGKQKGGSEQTSVEELLAYIEGDGEDTEQSNTSKSAKKQKKKQRKLQVSENEMQQHVDNQHSPDQLFFNQMSSPAKNGSSSRPNSHHAMDSIGVEERSVESHEVFVDEYDDELEEFKKFCFDDSPVGPRKKIAVSLNMNDIMSKIR